ncbi:MAG TPA: hypothetical protein VJ904_05320 [Tichowtungia sp.]|nr:hypothetical protein [Tichowtungia sp.]
MKKTCAVLTALLLLQCGFAVAQEVDFAEDTGGVYYPLQLALYPTVQLVPYDGDFAGLRLNIIGVNQDVSGLDIGIANQTDGVFHGVGVGVVNLYQEDFFGVNVGFINNVDGNMNGFQGIPYLTFWNAVNLVDGHSAGVQGGLFNRTESLVGLQGGLVNVAYDAKGVMLGLYNYSKSFQGLHLGLVNIVYEDMTGGQIGIYNGVRDVNGLQLGLINQCQNLYGLQLGLVNIYPENQISPAMILANWQF